MRIIILSLLAQLLFLTTLFAEAPYLTNTMQMMQTANLNDLIPTKDDRFGQSVAMENNIAVIGVPNKDKKGVAYVYRFSLSTAQYERIATLKAALPEEAESFGESVDISKDGQTIVIGAPGTNKVYIFDQPFGGWHNMTETVHLGPSSDSFGSSVAIDNTTVIVGAPEYTNINDVKVGAAYILTKSGDQWQVSATLTSSDAEADSKFGYAVDISGNTAVVSAPFKKVDDKDDSGKIYLFERPSSSWSDMQETKGITATDNEAYGYFGFDVAITDDTVIVGAPGKFLLKGVGYIFTNQSEHWSAYRESRLTSSDEAIQMDTFGVCVAISDTIVVISSSERLHVFYKEGADWHSAESDEIYANVDGSAIDIGGDAVIIGDFTGKPGAVDNAGTVYILNKGLLLKQQENQVDVIDLDGVDPNAGDTFVYEIIGGEDASDFSINNSSGVIRFKTSPNFENPMDSNHDNKYVFFVQVRDDWDDSSFYPVWVQIGDERCEGIATHSTTLRQQQKDLIGSTTDQSDAFGQNIALHEETLVVGAPNNDYSGSDSGIVYVFVYDQTTHSYKEVAKLSSLGIAPNDHFGKSVAINGNTIAVAAPDHGSGGAVYIFEKPSAGWSNMHETAILSATDTSANNNFGYSIAISDRIVVVGASGDFVEGRAYLFEKTQQHWSNMTQTLQLTASDSVANNGFGSDVAIDGNTVVVGAGRRDVGSKSHVGALYLFVEPASGWNTWRMMRQNARLSASDAEENDQLGSSVAIDGDTVVATATGSDINGHNDAGAVYLFQKSGERWSDMTQTAKLTASDALENDHLGSSVAISGDTVIAGVSLDDTNGGDNAGTAYLFDKTGSQWKNQVQTAIIGASDAVDRDFFGSDVDICGSTVVVGAPGHDTDGISDTGSVYLFNTQNKILLPALMLYLMN